MGTSRLEQNAVVHMEGKEHRLHRKISDTSWQLEEVKTGLLVSIEHNELLRMIAKQNLTFPGSVPASKYGVHNPQVGEVEKLRQAYARAVLNIPNSRKQLELAINELWKKTKLPEKAPGYSTVLRWKKRLIQSSGDTRALVDSTSSKGNRTSRYPSLVIDSCQQAISARFLKRERNSIQETLDDAMLRIIKENELRLSGDELKLPTRTLGKHRIIADGNTGIEDEFQIVSAAANVFHQWPNNFIGLLKDIGKGIEANGEGGVRKQFASIYQGLFKNRAINPREQADFLRVAFLEFAEHDWDRGFVDHKLLQQVRGKVEKRFITQSELAAKAGIAPVTASRWIKDQKMQSRHVQCGKSMRILVDSSQNMIPRTTAGKTYCEREAAKRMGLSVLVLRSLKDSGIFKFNHLLPTKGGYHELDMDAFNEKLMALAPSHALIGNYSSEHISLKTALNGRHDSSATKLEIVRALLAGDLVITGNMDETIAGLLMNRAECRRFVISVRRRAAGDTMIPHVCEKYLHCDASTIPGLLQMGLLDGYKTSTCLRITIRSAEAFKKDYVSLASVAKDIGTTSSRGLMRCCNKNGIQLLLVPKTHRRGLQPFIRLSDRAKLMAARANKGMPALVGN